MINLDQLEQENSALRARLRTAENRIDAERRRAAGICVARAKAYHRDGMAMRPIVDPRARNAVLGIRDEWIAAARRIMGKPE